MPPENRTEIRKQQTREKIIRVAVGLFQRQGFDSTTMDQIAAEADIARKTLYNHFTVKEAIVDDYVRDLSTELARASRKKLHQLPDTRSRLLAALDTAYRWVETNPEFTGICLGYRMKNMWRKAGGTTPKTGTQDIMAEILHQGQQTGEIRQDISVRLLVIQLDMLRGSVVMDWFANDATFDLRKEIARIVDLFLYGAIHRKKEEKCRLERESGMNGIQQ